MRFAPHSAVGASLLGLVLLAGCGGSDNGHGNGSGNGSGQTAATRHYRIKDLGPSPTTIKVTKSASRILPSLPYRIGGTTRAISDLGASIVSFHSGLINNVGQVTGTAGNEFDPNSQQQAYLYQNGNKTILSLLGGKNSLATDINDKGQIVGVADLPASQNASHAFLYSQGQATDLGTLGGSYSEAAAVNNNGQVVGLSTLAPLPQTSAAMPLDDRPAVMFLYDKGQMRALPAIEGYNSPTPYAISDSGVIVGSAMNVPVLSAGLTANNTPNGSVAFVSAQGQTQLLPFLPSADGSGTGFAGAFGINRQGVIVGFSTNTNNISAANFTQHAVSWLNGVLTDLGTLPTGNHSIALGINSAGDIVGGSTAEPNSAYDLGFLYHAGQMTNLNSLIDANSGWLLLSAYSINDAGQIVGLGKINNEFHLYLLTPDTNTGS